MDIDYIQQVSRKRVGHVAGLVVLGFAAKLNIFYKVAVNGDTGLYLYDAKQLLWGSQMLVEYPSRSPLMEHLLAVVIDGAQSPLVSARWFMLFISLTLGVAIYAFARQLHSHRAGLLSMALFYFTPFSLVWGLWVKTEQVAGLLLITAFIVAIHVIDRDSPPLWSTGLIGGLFGAAFLIRRVAIVHVAAFAIFVVWYRYKQDGRLRSTFTAAGAVIASTAITLAVAYLLLSHGDLGLAVDIAYHHTLALFLSDGQGSLGWVGLQAVRPATAFADIPWWLAIVCQKCGLNTVKVFTRTILVTLPVLLLLVAFLRSYATKASDFVANNALPTMLVVFSALVVLNVHHILYPDRVAAAILFAAAVAIVWFVEPMDWERFWQPTYALLLLVLAGLTAGYIYRDRILYVTYFQDLYPYVVILASITAVEWARDNRDWLVGTHSLKAAIAVVLIIAGGVAGANTYPYQPDGPSPGSDWFSIELAQDYSKDIEQRAGGGAKVFTAQPLYAIEGDHRIAQNVSRKYYVFEAWFDSRIRERIGDRLESDLRSGDVRWAAIDDEALELFKDRGVLRTFQANYCQVPTALYPETGGALYRYSNDTSHCYTYEHYRPQ